METLLYWVGAITAILAAIFAVRRAGGSMFRTGKKWDQFLEDWNGTPARPGRSAVPGVMERLVDLEKGLAKVRHEMFPNSGSSLRDSVDRVEEGLSALREHVGRMTTMVDAGR